MAALDFPSSPTLNQTYTANGKTWIWDGSSWLANNVLTVGGGGTGVTTLTGIVKGNGTSAFSAATAGTDYQAAITASGILKGAGAGSVSAAVAGTDYVTPTGTETLTNKTISVDSNTVSGIAVSSFVLSNASGNIDGAAAAKAIPTGVVVGTTDTQTLSAKTLTNPTVTDYVETLFSATGSSFTISLTNGTVQKLTTNATPTTITLPASVAGKSFTIIVAYGGAHTLSWAGGSTLKWAGGTAPTPTATAGKFDIFVFTQDGTNTYGRSGGANF